MPRNFADRYSDFGLPATQELLNRCMQDKNFIYLFEQVCPGSSAISPDVIYERLKMMTFMYELSEPIPGDSHYIERDLNYIKYRLSLWLLGKSLIAKLSKNPPVLTVPVVAQTRANSRRTQAKLAFCGDKTNPQSYSNADNINLFFKDEDYKSTSIILLVEIAPLDNLSMLEHYKNLLVGDKSFINMPIVVTVAGTNDAVKPPKAREELKIEELNFEAIKYLVSNFTLTL